MSHIYVICFYHFRSRGGSAGKKLYKILTFRQLEYLVFIRKNNILLYGEVLKKLHNNILGTNVRNDLDQMLLEPNLPRYRYDEEGPGYQL